jgi:hypothetical protein
VSSPFDQVSCLRCDHSSYSWNRFDQKLPEKLVHSHTNLVLIPGFLSKYMRGADSLVCFVIVIFVVTCDDVLFLYVLILELMCVQR